MSTIELVSYLIIFFGAFLIFFKLFKDSNFEKCFKQGKVVSIIVTEVLLSIILAFLCASALLKCAEVIKNLIKQ